MTASYFLKAISQRSLLERGNLYYSVGKCWTTESFTTKTRRKKVTAQGSTHSATTGQSSPSHAPKRWHQVN
jgi:hypothetical protein